MFAVKLQPDVSIKTVVCSFNSAFHHLKRKWRSGTRSASDKIELWHKVLNFSALEGSLMNQVVTQNWSETFHHQIFVKLIAAERREELVPKFRLRTKKKENK